MEEQELINTFPETKSCECENCKQACRHKPGWFLPSEIKPLAEAMNITEEKLFNEYLAVDWYERDPPIFLLAPAITNSPAGEEYPGNPRGTCVFYNNGKCSVHTLGKPFECKTTDHDSDYSVIRKKHGDVAEIWSKYQNMIKDLLGRDPEDSEYDIIDHFLCL